MAKKPKHDTSVSPYLFSTFLSDILFSTEVDNSAGILFLNLIIFKNVFEYSVDRSTKAKILSTKSAGFLLCILHSSVFSIHYSLPGDRIFEMNREDLRLKNE